MLEAQKSELYCQCGGVVTCSHDSFFLSLATHQGDALVMEESNTVNKPAEPMVSDSGRPLGQAFEDVAHTQEDGRLIITNLCSGS